MRTLSEERRAAAAADHWDDQEMPIRYGLGMVVGLIVIAFMIGDVVGHVMATKPTDVSSGAVRFEPGRYLIETANDSWGTVVTFDGPWWVRPLPMPPSE